MTRALALFSVGHRGCRVRVRILPTQRDVEREFRGGRPRRDGLEIHAFFLAMLSPDAKHVGTIVLPADRPLAELVAHETVHAVMSYLGGVHCSSDEELATLVGILTDRIHRRCEQLGVGGR